MMIDTLTRAKLNRDQTSDLLRDVELAVSEFGYEYVAQMLDMDELELQLKLNGTKDLTLTELNRIGIVTGMVVRFDVVTDEVAFFS